MGACWGVAVEKDSIYLPCEKHSTEKDLDPRIKLLSVLSVIILIVIIPPGKWLAYVPFLAIVLALILFHRLPLKKVLLRSISIIPFVLVITIFLPFFKGGPAIFSGQLWIFRINISQDGIVAMLSILIKAWLCMLSLIWLTTTTTITSLLEALRRLHFPAVMVMILSSMYRFIFVIIEETRRMKHARDCRLCGEDRLIQFRSLGNLIGTLFIRSYERSERVYAAMLARGFDGTPRTVNTLRLRKSDFVFVASLGSVLIFVLVMNYRLFI